MRRYLAHTDRLAAETPASRNRIIDFWRATAIFVVVFGHWLAASIWLQADGEIALKNSLQWIPYAAWITWVVQVMPIFFFVGGYANARALGKVEDGGQPRREWIATRVRRLFTPVVPLLLVWLALIVALRPFVPADVVRAGVMSATVPLWFMAVYLVMVATAPFTHAWWRRHRWGTVGGIAAAAVAIDAARFVVELPGIGWVNFIFVWAAVHQLGYWWAARDTEHRPIRGTTGWAIAATALVGLIAVTWGGLYPVAMVGVPGVGATNMTPPTSALALLGLVQAGVILGTQGPVRRLTARHGAWRVVVAVSGVIMTVYLWHLSAMSLVAAGGLYAFGGAAFEIEPGTTTWWLTRPVWLGVLVGATTLLVVVFARFEWLIRTDHLPTRVRHVTAGVLLCAGSAGAVAWWGLAAADATINWIIPLAAVAGAAIIGAYPRRAPRNTARAPVRGPSR